MSDEFSKFIRFFTTRLIQSVVQARLGSPLEQACCVQSEQTDWFNTRVDELGEIAAYIRQAVKRFPPQCSSLALEFLLYTAEGQFLPLEAWQVSVEEEECDYEVNIRTQLYHQLGTLLRSAAAAARVTPMFRYYVRRQSADSFVILYRVYEGEPSADLGSDAKSVRIGQLASPHGQVCLDLFYRTKMEIEKERKESCPKVIEPPSLPKDRPCRPSFSDAIPVAGGELEPTSPMSVFRVFSASPAPVEIPSPRATQFRLGRSTSSEESTVVSEHHRRISESSSSPSSQSQSQRSFLRTNSFPFAALLSSTMLPADRKTSLSIAHNTLFEERTSSPSPEKYESTESKVPSPKPEKGYLSDTESENEQDDMQTSDDSYVKILALGARECLGQDLGEFIKECRLAPTPHFSASPPEVGERLQRQLDDFKSVERSFDEFVRQVRSMSTD